MTTKKRRQRPAWEDGQHLVARDVVEHLDWSKIKRRKVPAPRAPARTICLRIRKTTLEKLKLLAERRGVAYAALINEFLAERVQRELDELAQ